MSTAYVRLAFGKIRWRRKQEYEEQQHFIDEISDIIERKNIDVVILSGDVFDTSNPPAAAEAMFFNL